MVRGEQLHWFKAHLRRTDSLAPIMGARPTPPLDAAGVAIPQNQAMGRAMGIAQAAYDKADNIAFSDLMKACRRNPKTKILTETGDFEGAFALITRLKSRYNNIDEVKKASHLLKYHSLAQKEQESGADYVAREQQEFVALMLMTLCVSRSLFKTRLRIRNIKYWLRPSTPLRRLLCPGPRLCLKGTLPPRLQLNPPLMRLQKFVLFARIRVTLRVNVANAKLPRTETRIPVRFNSVRRFNTVRPLFYYQQRTSI